MNLLSQLGIATNASRPGTGGGFDASRLRGYLEIEDETLGKALDDHFEAAKQLFGTTRTAVSSSIRDSPTRWTTSSSPTSRPEGSCP